MARFTTLRCETVKAFPEMDLTVAPLLLLSSVVASKFSEAKDTMMGRKLVWGADLPVEAVRLAGHEHEQRHDLLGQLDRLLLDTLDH